MNIESPTEEMLHKLKQSPKEEGAKGMDKALEESGALSELGFTESQEHFISMLVKNVYIKGYNDGVLHMLGEEPMNKADIDKALKEE